MRKLGHSQIRDGDKVGCGPETTRGSFCLLDQSIHGLNISIAAVVQHAAHYRVDALLQSNGELLERLQTATRRPTEPVRQLRFGHGFIVSAP